MAKRVTHTPPPVVTESGATLEALQPSRTEIAAYRRALRAQTKIPAAEQAILAKMLASYGVPLEKVGNFLAPESDASLPPPFSLLDMRAAVDLVIDRAEKGKKFAVWADYDADGNTSAAMLGHILEAIGVKDPALTIPYRKEGFGLNIPGIRKLREQGADVLIVADSGTVAHTQIAKARKLGMEVVVLDHHRPRADEALPDALVVNPNRNDDPSPHGALAAASVTYTFARDLAIGLRERGKTEKAEAIDFDRLKAISAIGVVADVVSLKDSANRYIVREGLKEINSDKYPGLNALKDLYGGNLSRGEITAEDIAFTIGPGINAAGRLGDPMVGMRLLMARSAEEAEPLAKKIKAANEERKLITESITKAAEEKAEAFLAAHPNAHFLMVEDEEWQAGVVGIVAGRLKEKYHLPTAVGHIYTDTDTGEKRTTYSIRSVEGVDFFDRAVEPILGEAVPGVLKIGGHAMAAGMTIRAADKEDILDFIDRHLGESVEKAEAGRTVRYLDALTLDELRSPAFQRAYERMEPFGQGLRRPQYVVRNVQVKSIKRVGADKQHIQFAIGSPDAEDKSDAVHGGILFRGVGSTMGNILTSPTRRDEAMDMVIDPAIKEYNGQKRLTFTVQDIANVRRLGQTAQKEELEAHSGVLLEKREQLQAAELAEMAAKPRRIEHLKDETNTDAQKALKRLFEAKVAVLDTETTGLDAGAETATKANGLTQIAAITAYQRSNGHYALREFNQTILPVTPAHFGWQLAAEEAEKKGEAPPIYDRKVYEYTITPDALAVTNTRFTRDRIDGPITGMLTGAIRQDEAKPFYEAAPRIAKLLTDYTPAAYNAPFDMPVLARHISDVLEARVGHPEARLNIPAEAWEKWEEQVRDPLLKALDSHPGITFHKEFDEPVGTVLPRTVTNPAEYRCLMHGAMAHKGFGISQRLQHVAPRDYGIAFTQDDSAHDALADVGPLVYLFADQLEHFSKTYRDPEPADGKPARPGSPTRALSMRGLWQHVVQQAVEQGRAQTAENGDIVLSFPRGTKELKPFFEAFQEVGERNPRTKAYVGIRSITETEVRLMGREKEPPVPKPLAPGSVRRSRASDRAPRIEYYKSARHLNLFKKTLTWRDMDGLEAVIAAEPFDSSSKLDITVRGAEGKPVTFESLSIGSLRPSAAFLKNHPEALEANLRLIQTLGDEDRVGRVILEEDGISVKGHHGRFGEVKFLTSLPVAAEDAPALTESIRTHLDFLMKVGAIPGVHSTTRDMGDLFGEEPAEEEGKMPLREPMTYVRLGKKLHMLMEVRKDLFETVAAQMGVDTMALPAELPGGGIVHFDHKQSSYLIEGTVENFRDINLPLRDASWLLHRLNNLPGIFSGETEISKDKLVLHFDDGVPVETLQILSESHVAFRAGKDRITVPLDPLMNDPFHWSQEIGRHQAMAKTNASRVNPAPPPPHFTVLRQALFDDTVEEAYFSRDGKIWLSDARHKSLPFDISKPLTLLDKVGERLEYESRPRIVATLDNTIDFDASTLLLTADIGNIGHKGLRYQLGKLGGMEHVPAQEVNLRAGRITLVPPVMEPLQDTSYTQELRGLAEYMQSRHINPLLDNLRELMQSEDVVTPHHGEPARYMAQASKIADWVERHSGQLTEFNKELNGLLDKELEFRFERGAHSIFDDVASLLLMEETLRHQDSLGKLATPSKAARPAMETVRDFADGLEKLEFQRERVREGCIEVQKRMLGFSEGQTARTESLAKTMASYYIARAAQDEENHDTHLDNAKRWLKKVYPISSDDLHGYQNMHDKDIDSLCSKNLVKIRDFIAKGLEEAGDEHQPFQLANQLVGTLDKLWDNTRTLNRSLNFHTALLKGAVALDNREKREQVREASTLLTSTFQNNTLETLHILEQEGGVSDVRVLDNGRISFDASALLAEPERWSNRLSELNTGTRARPQAPYILYDTSTLLTLLFAQQDVPGHQDVGLLGIVKDMAELKVETPVLTDMVLAEFLFSNAPLRPKDIFRLDAEGRATGIVYAPPTRTGEDYPKMQERLELLKDLYNGGNVRFMETRTATEYLDTIRHNRNVQQVYRQHAPQHKRLETLNDDELKLLLLDRSSDLSVAVGRKIKQLGLRNDTGEVSIADGIAQLRREHGRELPVFVRYEGTDVRGRIIQRLNRPEKPYNAPIDKKYNPHNTRDTLGKRAFQFDRASLDALGEGSFQSTGGMFMSMAVLLNRAGGFLHTNGEIDGNLRPDGSVEWHARDDNGRHKPRTFQTAYADLLQTVSQGLGALRRDTSIKDVRFTDTGYNVKAENEFAQENTPSLLYRHLMAQSDRVKTELTARHMERLAAHTALLAEHLQQQARKTEQNLGRIDTLREMIDRVRASLKPEEEPAQDAPGRFAARYATGHKPAQPSPSSRNWSDHIRETGQDRKLGRG